LILSDDVSDGTGIDDGKGSGEDCVELKESELNCAEYTVFG